MTQQEIAATAARLRDLGVPDSLNRWLRMTPESLAANRRRISQIVKQQYRREPVRKIANGRSSISAGHAANLDEAGKAILKEITKEARAKKTARLQHLRELKMSKTGTKESQLRAQREKTSKKKPHPSDAFRITDANQIDQATKFQVSLFHDGQQQVREATTLAEANALAQHIVEEFKSNRRAMIHAVMSDGSSIFENGKIGTVNRFRAD